MGACVSSHKRPDSSMRMGFSVDSKPQSLLIPTPTNEKPIKGENPNAEFDGSQSMKSNVADPNIGAKDEAFFDSQAWLESDCEDDFISVNGDYIPSGSNSPNYQRNTLGKPQLNEVSFSDGLPHSKPESSPTDKKMRLSELLKESLQEEQVNSEDQTAGKICQKSSEKSPCVSQLNSICSSDRTPNIDPKQEKEETLKATQCCLPSFVQSLSFRERKTPQSSSHKENNTI
ncbi:hypothetical protein AAC387_Pa02g4335 [Persea americana]